MSAFFKAVALGIFLALLVSVFIGSSGSSGGLLNVKYVTFEGYHFYWSWALFLVGTGLSFAIFMMID